MLKPLLLNTDTGGYKAKSLSIFDFDVTSEAGQTEFSFTAGLMTAGSLVEVLINGREYREGNTYDFERNVDDAKIIFSSAVPKNAWVRIKIYPYGVA